MIGIDTNIVVRLLTRDDPAQFEAAVKLVRQSGPERPLFVNPLVIAETVWVLEGVYGIDRAAARRSLAGLLDTVEIRVPEAMHLGDWKAWLHARHADFSDVVIADLNAANGCEKTMTFDRRAAKTVETMELLA